MKIHIDARLVSKTLQVMLAVMDKETKLLLIPSVGEWGGEPGQRELITIVGKNDTVGAAVSVPVNGGNITDPVQVPQSAVKLLSSIATQTVKRLDKFYKETGTDMDQREYKMILTLDIDGDKGVLSIMPDGLDGAGVTVHVDVDLSDAIPAEGMARLFTNGGGTPKGSDGNALPTGGLSVWSSETLGILSRVAKICKMDIKLYDRGHKGTTFQASCGMNSEESGDVLVSMYATPSPWGEGANLDSADDVVEIPKF